MEKKIVGPEPFIVQYLHEKASKARIPINISLELTARCNFSCKMCYVHNEDCNHLHAQELTSAQWLEIAAQAKRAGAVFVLLTGGEPLLRTDFFEIYEAMARMGFVLSLNTNGSLIDEQTISLFRRFPPNRINVSLYGGSNETYSSLCGAPAFDRVSSNIERLQAEGIPVKVNSSLTPWNADDLDAILQFCDSHNLVFKGTGYMFPSARLDSCADRLPAARVAALRAAIDRHLLPAEMFAERARRIAAGIAFERDQDCPELPEEGQGIRCRAGRTSAWIDWRGRMSYCGMVPAPEENDVLSCGFDACWQATMRNAAAVRMPAKCTVCEYRHICSVCGASYVCETGGADSLPRYVCEIAAAMQNAYESLLPRESGEDAT